MLYVNYISIKLYGGIAGKVFKVKLLELNLKIKFKNAQ